MESNTWCPLLTAAMILSGLTVHVNGFGSALVSATKRLMAAWRSTTERKTPRFKRRRLSLAKNPSTALSQEHEVGVKWKTKRGGSSQARTVGVCDSSVVGYLMQSLRNLHTIFAFETRIAEDACFSES